MQGWGGPRKGEWRVIAKGCGISLGLDGNVLSQIGEMIAQLSEYMKKHRTSHCKNQ